MLIANPINDIVFKRMKLNEKAAQYFVRKLSEQTIGSVKVKPQEFTYTDDLAGFAVCTLNYVAKFKTNSEESKKI